MIQAIRSRFDYNAREKDASFEKLTWRLIFTIVILGLFFILLSAFIIVKDTQPGAASNITMGDVKDYLIATGAGLLIAGACFCIGSLLGFLFGIPRVAKAPDPADGDNDNGRNAILQNDNLVEISDWITKIIVGVGLTQLHQIGPALVSLGEHLASGLDHHKEEIATISVVIVLYFSVSGFICTYLWTRLYFAEMLNNRIRRLSKELKEKEKELGYMESELTRKDQQLEKEKKEVRVFREIFNDPIAELKIKREEENDSSDPHKGQFGGKAELNGRKLQAQVTQSTFDKDLFVVALEVTSTDVAKPLNGTVDFHLHPTFINPLRTVNVENGVAKLRLIAYGAFTVGVVCDNGGTRLELDLALLKDAPVLFKER